MVKSVNKKRIGILGGSFNPIHHGHLLMAEIARQKMDLDQVIFMPAYCSPFKSNVPLASPQDRLNMVSLAIADHHYFSVSDLELNRQGISYTIDTLRTIRDVCPSAELFWIVGHDHVPGLKKWKYFSEIIAMASFVAVSRMWFNISSSEIRQTLRDGGSIRYLTPDAVVRYIEGKRLYRNGWKKSRNKIK